jgi:hypothetical protein
VIPFTLAGQVTTAGTFSYYYEVLLTAAAEYQDTPLTTVSYTVCGNEKVSVGTFNNSNSIYI